MRIIRAYRRLLPKPWLFWFRQRRLDGAKSDFVVLIGPVAIAFFEPYNDG